MHRVLRSSIAIRVRNNSTNSNPPLLSRVLIANRGEIACRVITTCRKLGIETVAVYSDEDRRAKHVRMADWAHYIGPAPSLQSYLVGEKIVSAAHAYRAQGIHPGYGFLSENAAFAELCRSEHIEFIGPPPSAILAMGSKSQSKHLMSAAKVPILTGYHGDDQSNDLLLNKAIEIGFPVIIKPVMGGGGKGMRIVFTADEFLTALESSRSEAIHSFKDDRVLVEKYLQNPRHVEVQVFADKHGNAVHLFERDCSVQRRHQKIFEESPAPGLSHSERMDMGAKAVAAAKAVGYVGAGTVEFIMDSVTHQFFFMEMNTRLQVEHPVTESVTGMDLVEWQLRVASGQRLPKTQEELTLDGHAIEARIYAEDPSNKFMPSAGVITHLATATPDAVFSHVGARGVRIDGGFDENDLMSTHYDPMIAKLIVKADNRENALRMMHDALGSYQVVGVDTNIEFLRRVSTHPAFKAGGIGTGFIPKFEKELLPEHTVTTSCDDFVMAAIASTLINTNKSSDRSFFRVNSYAKHTVRFQQDSHSPVLEAKCEILPNNTISVNSVVATHVDVTPLPSSSSDVLKCTVSADISGHRVRSTVVLDQKHSKIHVFTATAKNNSNVHLKLVLPPPAFLSQLDEAHANDLISPLPGEIRKVFVKAGQTVMKGERLVVMVAMKMEHAIVAPFNGVIKEVLCAPGQAVAAQTNLVEMERTK